MKACGGGHETGWGVYGIWERLHTESVDGGLEETATFTYVRCFQAGGAAPMAHENYGGTLTLHGGIPST